MNIWFTRSGSEYTPLNNPNSLDYVPGEPPIFPKTNYNYRQKCLSDGFARIGWPNTGDLTQKNPVRLAPNGYDFNSIEKNHQLDLKQFSSIRAGDFILIPADEDRGDVHLGIVLTKEKRKVLPYIEPRPLAYFYYYDIENGDYYECAHRVNVLWAKDGDEFAIIHSNEVAQPYIWNGAFSPVKNEERIFPLAQEYGLA